MHLIKKNILKIIAIFITIINVYLVIFYKEKTTEKNKKIENIEERNIKIEERKKNIEEENQSDIDKFFNINNEIVLSGHNGVYDFMIDYLTEKYVFTFQKTKSDVSKYYTENMKKNTKTVYHKNKDIYSKFGDFLEILIQTVDDNNVIVYSFFNLSGVERDLKRDISTPLNKDKLYYHQTHLKKVSDNTFLIDKEVIKIINDVKSTP